MKLQPCEIKDCRRPASAFAQGRHVCPEHDPPGSVTCSHSLAPSGRCAYCGARTPAPELATAHRTGHARPDELDTLELHMAHLAAARHLESKT